MAEKELIAVLDAETNWDDRLMSVGVVTARDGEFLPLNRLYFVIEPEYERGGIYEDSLFLPGLDPVMLSKEEAVAALTAFFKQQGITKLFAYNARFDRAVLSALRGFRWFDIMGLARYRQFNPAIPETAECYSTGRMKRGFGVEPILRMLSGDRCYCEQHNALTDAEDELSIMRLLGHEAETYVFTEI